MKIFSHPNLLVYNALREYVRKCFKKSVKKVLKKFADIKKVRTFVPGEMAEWSIAAVLKTVELRGSGGSNPSLSALNSLQGVDFQPCRLFLYPKSCTKNAPTPFLHTSTGVFQIAHISYIIFHFLIPPDSTKCERGLQPLIH